MEAVDEFIALIKDALPPGHELQSHDLFPGIKYDGRMVFIVDDDTAGNRFLMDSGRSSAGRDAAPGAGCARVRKRRRGLGADEARQHNGVREVHGGRHAETARRQECKHARRHHD
jgi:hypothetical protein